MHEQSHVSIALVLLEYCVLSLGSGLQVIREGKNRHLIGCLIAHAVLDFSQRYGALKTASQESTAPPEQTYVGNLPAKSASVTYS